MSDGCGLDWFLPIGGREIDKRDGGVVICVELSQQHD